MRAIFFVEGGPRIGLGHLRRCTALAGELIRKGWDCRFLAHEAGARDWLICHGYPFAEGAVSASGRLPAADYAVDVFVLDSYEVDNEEVAAKVRGKAGVILAFDDLMDRHPIADVILNSGVLAPTLDWPGRGRVEHLLGPAYHPLPQEYLGPPSRREPRETVARVLLTLGGAGPVELFATMASVIRRVFPAAAIDCAVGPFIDPGERLESIGGVRLLRGPDSLRPLMLECDLAVAASGQTLFELAATGTPAVAVCLADNQRPNLLGMERCGSVLSAGSAQSPDFERTLTLGLEQASSESVRGRLSDAGRRLIDGQGAARVETALARWVARKRSV